MSTFENTRIGPDGLRYPLGHPALESKGPQAVNPADDFDYGAALLQFVLSNPLVDVALVGIRTVDDAARSAATWRDETGRIDVEALWGRYV